MKRIVKIIIGITVCICGCNAQESSLGNERLKCQISGFTSPGVFKATNVYNAIDGQVTMILYPDSIEGAGHIVSIVASQNNWLKLSIEGLVPPENALWIKGGEIGTATRNYSNEPISLYLKPSKESEVIDELHNQQIVLIYGGAGKWAYIKGKGANGKKVEGWIEPEMQCPSPYTTCPTPI